MITIQYLLTFKSVNVAFGLGRSVFSPGLVLRERLLWSSKPPLHRRIESVDGVCRRVSRSKRSHPPRGAPRRVRELDRTCAGARATPPGPAPGGAGSVVVRASLARRARAYCHSASCSDFALSNRGMINHVSRRTAATPASARLRRGSGARRSVPLPPRCDGGGSRRRRFSQPRLKLL